MSVCLIVFTNTLFDSISITKFYWRIEETNVDDEHILLRLKNSVGIHSSWFSGLIYLDTHTVVDDNFHSFALNLLFSGQRCSLEGMSNLK